MWLGKRSCTTPAASRSDADIAVAKKFEKEMKSRLCAWGATSVFAAELCDDRLPCIEASYQSSEAASTLTLSRHAIAGLAGAVLLSVSSQTPRSVGFSVQG